jgi:hypothetical protein
VKRSNVQRSLQFEKSHANGSEYCCACKMQVKD